MALLPGCNSSNPNLGAAPTQASQLTLLNPAAAPAGSTGFTLLVNGAGFVPASVVMWNNGSHATALATTLTNSSGTQLSAVVPSALIALPGSAAIDVTSPPPAGTPSNQNQGNNISNFLAFCSLPVAAAVTPALSPASATVGGAAFTLTVTGTGFLAAAPANSFNGSAVYWNNSQRLTNFVSSTQLTAQILASDIAAPGNATITVVLNPGSPCPVSSNKVSFQINAATPAMTPALAPKTSASISGAVATFTPVITSGPRFVAFVAISASPSTDAGVGVDQIFLRDTCIGAAAGCAPQTSPVSMGLAGAAPDGASRSPSISADGRFVAFASDADNLVTGDSNGLTDIFVRDTCTGAPAGCTPTTIRVSVGPGGAEANAASDSPSISADGRFVAFDSGATNLTVDNGATGTNAGAFVRDTCFGVTGACTPATTRLETISVTQ